MPQSFDEHELLERVDNDLSFLEETVQMLESDGRALMNELREALAAGDAQAVGRTAHALKGMISNFCDADAQQSAFEVERLGKGGDLTSAAGAVATLADKLEALINELLSFVKAKQ